MPRKDIQSNRYSAEERQALLSRAKEHMLNGLRIAEAAAAVGVGMGTLSHWLAAERRQHHEQVQAQRLIDAAKLYHAGYPLSFCAAQNNVSMEALMSHLRQNVILKTHFSY